MPTSWARSLNTCARCSLLFLPTLHAVFAKHLKTRNDKAENGSILVREKNKTPHFEMQLTKITKKVHLESRRLNDVVLRGHVDASYLYIVYLL